MLRVIRSEFIKLGRRGSLIATVAATAAITVLGTAIPYLTNGTGGGGPFGGGSSQGSTSADAASTGAAALEVADGAFSGLADVSKLLGAVALVVAALAVANEYAHGTLKNLLVRQPNRLTLLGGKLTAIGLYVAALGALAATVAIPVSYAFAATHDVSTDTWALTEVFSAAGELVASNLVYAAIGGTLAVLLRSSSTAIGLGVGWALLGEQLIGSLVDIDTSLPGQLATGLTGGSEAMSTSGLLTGLAIWIAGLTTVALVAFHRREVTS